MKEKAGSFQTVTFVAIFKRKGTDKLVDFAFAWQNTQQPEQPTLLKALGNTPIRVNVLRDYLQFYPNREDAILLIDGFTNGFKVNYSGPRLPFDCKNLISAEQHAHELQEKLSKEIQAGRVAGPF